MQVWNEYILKNKDRFLNELKQLLAIPSISNSDGYRNETHMCASYIMDQLIRAGCDLAEIASTGGHPIVFGEKIISPGKPTVLVYGHYDVQPADPLALWDNDPFQPVVKDGKIIARGASDDKGQLFMHIKALETVLKTNTLACNIKFVIEGEEEIGSPNLAAYLETHREKLKADVVLISDTAMIAMEHPSIETGLRGLTYMELAVTGPNRDLHSGIYGGAVANPINILCRLIASLHDEDNRIAIPGFYDKVVNLTAEQRKRIAMAPFDLPAYKKDLGLLEIWGETGYTTVERTGIRPTLDVNGIWGGYTGKGAKTIIPAKAYAKISMRLVPNQEPEEIASLFQQYLSAICPPYIKVEINYLHGGTPVLTPTDPKAYRAAAKAIQTVLGKKPISVYSGGSIPVVSLFKKILDIDTVLLGFGLSDDNIHAPNEKFDLFNFYKGIETLLFFQKFLSE